MTAPNPASTPPAGDARRPTGPRLPDIPGPYETAGRVWRRLRRMSTALVLLFTLATVTVVATFIPQEPVIPPTVAAWRAGTDGPGQTWAALFDALGLFDVFGSWWFLALTGLLVVSLTGCLVPRFRAFARAVRRPPAAGRNLARLANHVELDTGLGPEAAAGVADRLLRRRRFRRRRLGAADSPTGNLQLAAERGHAREGGSLVFHVSFYVLLAGAVVANAFGFTGQVNVVEGRSFTDTRLGYGLAEPGRFFGMDDHRGFVVRLEEFRAAYHAGSAEPDASGHVALVPRDFVSTVTILEGGQPLRTERVRVNHPIAHDGMKLYQVRFGFAPNVVVRTAGGTVLFDDAVPLADEGGAVWTGVAKVAATEVERQIALELVLLPDADFGPQGMPISRSPEPRNPRLAAVLWYGPLGLERNVPATAFDRDAGARLPQPLILSEGETATFEPLGLEVAFTDLAHWSGFQVSREPGRLLLLAGAILMLGGLIPSLYGYRRRIWVDVAPRGDGSRVVLAGAALQRQSTFAEAFSALADGLREALPAPATAGRRPVARTGSPRTGSAGTSEPPST